MSAKVLFDFLVQSVVGGWGGEKLSGRDRLGKDRLGRGIKEKPSEGKEKASEAVTESSAPSAGRSTGKASGSRKARQQRKRLQHDDPFVVVENEVLEALRAEAEQA